MKEKRIPLVTVVMPTYNSQETVYKSVKSVVNQTHENVELIVIDGASTDKTVDIIEQFRCQFAENLTIVSESDSGIYDAMNKGIRLAKGELIGILSSNDTYERNAIEDIVAHYSGKNEYEILYGMQRYIRDGKETHVSIYHHTNLPNKMMAHPACFVTKGLYEKYGAFNLAYKISADYDFLWRMYDKEDVVFTPVYSIITDFHEGGASGTQVGYLETIKLRRKRGQISKGKYIYILARCKIGNLVRRIIIRT